MNSSLNVELYWYSLRGDLKAMGFETSSESASSDSDGCSPGVLKMSADWLRTLNGGEWSAITGSPLLKEIGVLLVPIMFAGSTFKKELVTGVLKACCS